MAEHEIIELNIGQPLDIRHSLERGLVFRWQRQEDWHYGVICENLIALCQFGSVLKIVHDSGETQNVIDLVSKFLRLDDNIEEIYSVIGTDERIKEAISAYRGLRILRQDPWECLIGFICSANSNIPRISSSMRSIALSGKNLSET